MKIWWGGEYIVTSYFHPQQYLEGVIISWHYIFTPDNIWTGGEYIVILYFHSWQYLVRGWLYPDIFSLLTIFSEGVNISWHYIFTPDNIWSGGDFIVTLYFHTWQYLVRGWLYRDIIFSLLTLFGEGVIISWHYIFSPDNIWWGGDYIMTYFHSWRYLVRGWLYPDIFSLLTIFSEGVNISWHYVFTPDNIWWGVIISWHYILTPGNIGWGDDYIVTLYFQSWQYLVRGVIISWHIFTPEDIWWGGDYIMTLQYHFWHYPRIWHWRWLYLNILTIQIWLDAVIPGFYYSYPYFYPMKLGGLKWLNLSMIPSLLLKLIVLVDMLMDCINSLWWTKICKKS